MSEVSVVLSASYPGVGDRGGAEWQTPLLLLLRRGGNVNIIFSFSCLICRGCTVSLPEVVRGSAGFLLGRWRRSLVFFP